MKAVIESSHKQEAWVSIGQIVRSGSGWAIKDLLVRWNERQVTRLTDMGVEIEYVYDAHRFDYPLSDEVQPGREAVEYYLEQAKSAVLAQAQNLAAQEAGFSGSN